MTGDKLKELLAEYGKVALVTYFAIFLLVLSGFALAIVWGFEVESAATGTGVLGAAWIATKLTQPIRIAGTLALTPIIARIFRRSRKDKATDRDAAMGSTSATTPEHEQRE